MPKFSTREVSELYEIVKPWCHPDHPFLDPGYSPGGYYPTVDFTPFIAKCLEEQNHPPIVELWSFLTSAGTAEGYLLKKILKTSCPLELGFDAQTSAEILAINLLIQRAAYCSGKAGWLSEVGVELIATRLASIGWVPPVEIRSILEKAAAREATVPDGDGKKRRMFELSQLALIDVVSPVPEGVLRVGDWLTRIPPTVRFVIHDFLRRDWAVGTLRGDLYYEYRCFGCRSEWSFHYLNWIGCFVLPDDSHQLRSCVTKDHIRAALCIAGFNPKKSAKRDDLIDMARLKVGLISSLFRELVPGRRTLKPEWSDPLKEWSCRVDRLKCLAAAIFNFVATSTLRAG